MREIKFRAWINYQGGKMMSVESIKFVGGTHPLKCTFENGWLFFTNSFELGHLLQFTGLRDKNGKEIYEGDILKLVSSVCEECGAKRTYDDPRSYIVQWDERTVSWECVGGEDKNWIDPAIWDESMSVIGNIYENPELLKDGR